MKRVMAALIALVLTTGCAAAFAETGKTTKIDAHFATAEEGQELMRDRTTFSKKRETVSSAMRIPASCRWGKT